jgi:hypothetical protein
MGDKKKGEKGRKREFIAKRSHSPSTLHCITKIMGRRGWLIDCVFGDCSLDTDIGIEDLNKKLLS